ncbi:MAG: hypothetical protein IJJ22_03870 [Oscillospiraceae bacterium]|nr:hypothetical protein [Oscillospiraceae bacterium]
MKFRFLHVIPLLLTAVLILCACGSGSTPFAGSYDVSGGSVTAQNIIESSDALPEPELSAVPTESPSVSAPLPTVKLEPAPTAPPTPSPTPKPTLGPYYPPTVKKSPLGEDCIEGSTIYFSAFADNCLKYEWQLEKDHMILDWADMAETFTGMKVAGIDSSYLVLANVPVELDGWSVRCVFTGSGDATVYSNSAWIHVSERTLKIHGKDRKTVKGTGNVSGFKAVIDYEGALWWVVEEYAGRTFTLRKPDADTELGINDVSFSIDGEGSLLIVIDGTEYRGKVSEERLGGFSASATVTKADSDVEMPVFFDYTLDSQRRENWNQIYLDIMLEFPVVREEPDAPEDPENIADDDSETETAASEASSFSDEPDYAEEMPPEDPVPETEFRSVRFILTRER